MTLRARSSSGKRGETLSRSRKRAVQKKNKKNILRSTKNVQQSMF